MWPFSTKKTVAVKVASVAVVVSNTAKAEESVMTFFAKVEAWFKKVFTKAPGWEKTASAVLTYVAPLLETVVALTAGSPAETFVAGVIGKVQSDMAVAAVTIEDATSSVSLTGVLTSIQTNLSSLLTAGQITDAATVTKVTAVVNTIIAEIKAVAAAVPAAV
jgi:hypothetical protein